MAMNTEGRGEFQGLPYGESSGLEELRLSHEDLATLVAEVEEVEIPESPNEKVEPQEEWERRYAMVKDYLGLLLNDSNLPHFVDIVRRERVEDPDTGEISESKRKITVPDLLEELRPPSVHMLAFKNSEGEALGYTIIRDPSGGQHETWIERLVIKNKYQNKRKEDPEQPHVGTQIMDRVKEWVFETPDYQGRPRQVLYAGVVMFVPNWQRTDQFFLRNGFDFKARFQGNAEVIINGEFMRRDTERFGYSRQNWEAEQALKIMNSLKVGN